jgi:hypothetical protein
MHFRALLVLAVCGLLGTCTSSVSKAQTPDLYERLVDPRALPRLNDSLSQPVRTYGEIDPYRGIDTVDRYVIISGDTGCGILTHLWLAYDCPDSLTGVKLWIDDNLVAAGTIKEFFTQVHKAFRPPLNYYARGGQNCDIQMVYRKNWRITVKPNNTSTVLFTDFEFRPIDRALALPTFDVNSAGASQARAEAQYSSPVSQWQNERSDSLPIFQQLYPGDTAELAHLTGSGLIQSFNLDPSTFDGSELDSILIEMYWDGSQIPSLRCPIADMFSACYGLHPTRSLYLQSDSSTGFTLTFPMPFAHEARIRAINMSHSGIKLNGMVHYDHEAVNPKIMGYFHADFSETNPTRYGVPHPVLHTLGRGRYVGMIFNILDIEQATTLEGNPVFLADSSSLDSFQYTGTEDYINSAFYFSYGTFTYPFAGDNVYLLGMYRFHCLDAMDFDSSFDFDLQHGNHNDCHEHYRTVAFSYKFWTPFWIFRDTVRLGEPWEISGSYYATNTSLTILLDSFAIATVQTDVNGSFSWQGMAQSNWPVGKFHLNINGSKMPEPVYIVRRPTLRLTMDSLPVVLEWGDTISFTGTGFQPGEKISLSLDSQTVKPIGQVVVGNDFRFSTRIVVPELKQSSYSVTATGVISGSSTCSDPIFVTQIRNYEFEKLLPPIHVSDSAKWQFTRLSYWWWAMWSEQAVADFFPDTIGDSISFGFVVPQRDTFSVYLFFTVGGYYGNYAYSIDGNPRGMFYSYVQPTYAGAFPSDTIKAGVMTLDSGLHTITFRYVGRDTASNSGRLNADHMVIAPKHYQIQPTGAVASTQHTQLAIFPNPSNGDFEISDMNSPGSTSLESLDVFDVLGKLRYHLSSDQLTLGGSQFLHLRSLPTGTYYLRYSLTGNAKSYSQDLLILK